MVIRSIKTKITLAMFSMLVTVLIAFGVSSYFLTKRYLLGAESSKLEFSVLSVSRELGHIIEEKKLLLQRITERDEFQRFSITYQEPLLVEYFNKFKDEFPVLSFINEYGEEELKTVGGEPSERYEDYGKSSFFQEAMQHKNEVIVLKPRYSSDMEGPVLAMAMASSDYFGDSFEGMLYGEMPLSQISIFLSKYRISETGMLAVINRNGKLLADSYRGSASSERFLAGSAVSMLYSSGQEVVHVGLLGVDSIVASSPVGDTGWLLLVSLPYNEFMAGPNMQIVYILIIFAVITVVGMLLSPLMSRDIVRPVRNLAESAQKVAGGDFSSHVKVGTQDEIGSLALSFNRMIDALKKSRDELVREKNYSEGIIKSMMNMLFVTDRYMEINRVNEAACRLLGYYESDLRGKHISFIFERGAIWEDCAEKIFKKTGESAETELMQKDGSRLPVLMSASGMMEEDERYDGIVFVAQDIYDIKAAQDLLKKSHNKLEVKVRERTEELALTNQDLQEFLFISSHDLQEPLRKIRAFSDRLTARYAGSLDERGMDYLRRMSSSAGRMQNLISSLLQFSRVNVDAGEFGPVDLNHVIKDVISDLEVAVEKSGGAVEVSPLESVDADAGQMRQLFQNLIGNALKYRKEDTAPVVKISGRFRDSEGNGMPVSKKFYEIRVEDNGIGFDEKYLDRIFRVFQRLHNRDEYEGTGIGLSLCRKIVERHSGALTARSRPGKGSVFIVTLPVRQGRDDEVTGIEGLVISRG